jgi:hypothetical protein
LVVEFEVDMTNTPLAEQIQEIMRAEVAPMDTQFDALGAQLNGQRTQFEGQRTVTVIQQEVRGHAAFNDFALTNPIVGEIEALHTDVDRVQAETPNWLRG